MNSVAGAIANGSEPSRMVRTVAIGFKPHRRDWVQIVAKGSDRRREGFKPSSRMVRSRREMFRAVANGSHRRD